MMSMFTSRMRQPSIARVLLSSSLSTTSPGGQNVNKLNTKAEIRFHVMSASWMPEDVRRRLIQYYPNKINKDGELIITSQEHRTQTKNRDVCFEKLHDMLEEAQMEPKEREIWLTIGEKGKVERRKIKSRRTQVKQHRIKNSMKFDDD